MLGGTQRETFQLHLITSERLLLAPLTRCRELISISYLESARGFPCFLISPNMAYKGPV